MWWIVIRLLKSKTGRKRAAKWFDIVSSHKSESEGEEEGAMEKISEGIKSAACCFCLFQLLIWTILGVAALSIFS